MRLRTLCSQLINLVKTIFVWYIAIYLPLGILCHAKVYVNFAHHRASAIPYEIMTIYKIHPASAHTLYRSWFWPPWDLQEGCLRGVSRSVSVGGRYQAEVSVGPVIWGDNIESKKITMRNYFGDRFFERLTWLEGRPVSGIPRLTLIATGANEWISNITESWDPVQQGMVLYSATVCRSISYVYNRNEVWYFFTGTTGTEIILRNNQEFAAIVDAAAKRPGGFDEFPLGTFPQVSAPEDDPRILNALDDMVTKADQWRAGMQSRNLLFQTVRWIDFLYAGLISLHDSSGAVIFWWPFLYLPTLPIRYLLFVPLIIVPHWFVVPFAYLYLLTLILLWRKCTKRFINLKHQATLTVLSGINLLVILYCSCRCR